MNWKATAVGYLQIPGSQSNDFTGHGSGRSEEEALKEAKLEVTTQINRTFDAKTRRAGTIKWASLSAVIDPS